MKESIQEKIHDSFMMMTGCNNMTKRWDSAFKVGIHEFHGGSRGEHYLTGSRQWMNFSNSNRFHKNVVCLFWLWDFMVTLILGGSKPKQPDIVLGNHCSYFGQSFKNTWKLRFCLTITSAQRTIDFRIFAFSQCGWLCWRVLTLIDQNCDIR